jgi:ribosomal protein S18 acetylase RimI-like enzyme
VAEAVVHDQVRLRAATRADLPALVALRRAVGWGSGGLEGSFSAAAAGRQVILLAELDGVLVGAVTVAPRVGLPPERGHVSDLLVSPLWRRRGIGTLLLRAAEEEIRRRGGTECTLDVDGSNLGALELYRRNGYETFRPAHFPWGTGYTLRKVLAPAAGPRGLLSRLGWRRPPG